MRYKLVIEDLSLEEAQQLLSYLHGFTEKEKAPICPYHKIPMLKSKKVEGGWYCPAQDKFGFCGYEIGPHGEIYDRQGEKQGKKNELKQGRLIDGL